MLGMLNVMDKLLAVKERMLEGRLVDRDRMLTDKDRMLVDKEKIIAFHVKDVLQAKGLMTSWGVVERILHLVSCERGANKFNAT